ncbi:hypothetical protein Tco_0465268 [Tanacetum coccineum]
MITSMQKELQKNSQDYKVPRLKMSHETYYDENKGTPFSKKDAWEILRSHAKWDTPDPFDLAEGDQVPGVVHEELFGKDARPRLPRKQRPDKKTKSDTMMSTEEVAR